MHYDKHNVTDNSFDGRGFHVFPTVFNYIERHADSLNTISIVNWLPINHYALSQDVDFSINSQLNDSLVLKEASNVLLNGDPLSADVLFLHFDQLDAAGHSFGFSSNVSEYREALSILDLYVDSLVGIIDAKDHLVKIGYVSLCLIMVVMVMAMVIITTSTSEKPSLLLNTHLCRLQ